MDITHNSVVDLYCRVTDQDGNEILSGAEPISYLHGGYGDIFPRLEEALTGKSVGETVNVTLEPKDAFGDYDAALVTYESLDHFETPPQVGTIFEGSLGDGGQSLLYRVIETDAEKVLLDANHPLAGASLIASATVQHIRRATLQDIAAKQNAPK